MSPLSALQPWSVATFLDWQAGEEDRYELVGGFPRKIEPATRRHDGLVIDLLVSLRQRLQADHFALFTAGVPVETVEGRVRRADLGVDRTPIDLDARTAREPVALFEILSSSEDFDRLRKIAEYKGMPFLRHIVLMEPDRALATLWSRVGQMPWEERTIEGLDAAIPLPGIGVELPLRELYDRILA